MFDILEGIWNFISTLGSSAPWIYRGWALLFSSAYRAEMRKEWKGKNAIYMLTDLIISFAFVGFELYIVYYLVVKAFLFRCVSSGLVRSRIGR